MYNSKHNQFFDQPTPTRMQQNKIKTAIILSEVFSQKEEQALLEPLNVDFPEILLPVGNATVFDCLVGKLISCNVENVIITVRKSNSSKVIAKYIKLHNFSVSFQILTILESSEVLALKLTLDKLDIKDDFYLISGPLITNINLCHLSIAPQCVLCITQEVKQNSLLTQVAGQHYIEYDDSSKILLIQSITNQICNKTTNRKVSSSTSLQFTGIYLFSQQFLKNLRNMNDEESLQRIKDEITIVDFLEACVEKKMQVHLYIERNDELSTKIDCFRTYRACCRAFLKNYFYPLSPDSLCFQSNTQSNKMRQYKQSMVSKDTVISKTASIQEICIIGAGTNVDGTVVGSQIGNNCVIDRESFVKDSIIFNSVRIRSGCDIEQSIIMQGATLERDICLPYGSVVGSNVYLTQKLLMHSIRCFMKHVWRDHWTDVAQFYGSQSSNVQILQHFLNYNITLNPAQIHALPPIYIMHQCFTTSDKLIYQKMMSDIESNVQNTLGYLRYPLCQMKESTIVARLDADILTQEGDEDEQEEEKSTSKTSSVKDSTAPSNLAVQINTHKFTAEISCQWIPNYLIQKSQSLSSNDNKIENVLQTSAIWFLTQCMQHGFQITDNYQSNVIMQSLWTEVSKDTLNASSQIICIKNHNFCVVKPLQQENNEIWFNQLKNKLHRIFSDCVQKLMYDSQNNLLIQSVQLRKSVHSIYQQFKNNAQDIFRKEILRAVVVVCLRNKKVHQDTEHLFREILKLLSSISSSEGNWFIKQVSVDYDKLTQTNDFLYDSFCMFIEEQIEDTIFLFLNILKEEDILDGLEYENWIINVENITKQDLDKDEDELMIRIQDVVKNRTIENLSVKHYVIGGLDEKRIESCGGFALLDE